MKKYKVTIRPIQPSQDGTIIIYAKSKKEASEMAEDLFADGDIDMFEFEPLDITSPDLCDVIKVEEIKEV